MADRCEHGQTRGRCDEGHPTLNDLANILEEHLEENLKHFNTKKMDGVDVIYLGHVEDAMEDVIERLRELA